MAGNLSSIHNIGLLREQLNLYLQEVLRVTVKHTPENLGNINQTLNLKDSNTSHEFMGF
jgi:hypothetical protein